MRCSPLPSFLTISIPMDQFISRSVHLFSRHAARHCFSLVVPVYITVYSAAAKYYFRLLTRPRSLDKKLISGTKIILALRYVTMIWYKCQNAPSTSTFTFTLNTERTPCILCKLNSGVFVTSFRDTTLYFECSLRFSRRLVL